jgi:hypothetical protein
LTTEAERWAWFFRQGSKLPSLPEELSPEQKEAMMLADRTNWSEAKTEAYRKALDEVEQAKQVASEAEARGEARGDARGKVEGLRVTVTDLCELLGIELTGERKAHLAALDLPDLETLRAHLKATKTWP